MGGHTIETGDQWVYHPKTGGKLIWLESLEWYLSNGWYKTPDDFPSEDSVELTELTRKELLSIASNKGITFGRNPSKQDIIEKLQES